MQNGVLHHHALALETRLSSSSHTCVHACKHSRHLLWFQARLQASTKFRTPSVGGGLQSMAHAIIRNAPASGTSVLGAYELCTCEVVPVTHIRLQHLGLHCLVSHSQCAQLCVVLSKFNTAQKCVTYISTHVELSLGLLRAAASASECTACTA